MVQVLAEMEAAGLVTASSLKSGQGRPKKVYKVVSAGQFLQLRTQAQAQAKGPTQTQDPGPTQTQAEGRAQTQARGATS